MQRIVGQLAGRQAALAEQLGGAPLGRAGLETEAARRGTAQARASARKPKDGIERIMGSLLKIVA